ncbi:MAG: hypothetical protein Q7U78_15050 [Gallionella sp.]|nr:hypothetical protein [Gallionella sp.]
MAPRIEHASFVVDEHIWGHRLYDEQLPHLVILEFLNVLQSNLNDPLNAPPSVKISYQPQQQIRLRSLLFNNPYVEVVRARKIPDDTKWDTWIEKFKRDAIEIEDMFFDHLRKSFTSFDDFARSIELLRSSAFEGKSNKRWSSKFVFPFGPDALYEDLRFDANNHASNDRRFFARTGELLYLMLGRASNGRVLGHQLVERLFRRPSNMNQLVKVLQGPVQQAQNRRDVGYLPYAQLPRFDQLCDDWLAILGRDIPIYDGLDHITIITGLNLLLYFLERGKNSLGDVEPIEIVCEVVSSQRTKVRALSGESFQANQTISLRAIKALVENVRTTPEWEAALNSEDPKGECARIMAERFQYDKDDEIDIHQLPGERLIEELLKKAEIRHAQHVEKIHNTWSRAIGLSSRRLARRVRYAPNDRFLKALVVTVVDDRMEFGEFLAEIYRRYGLVIGHVEGTRHIQNNQVDQEALMNNAEHLETRLYGLGLVRRLSDSCAFVENPFNRQGGM